MLMRPAFSCWPKLTDGFADTTGNFLSDHLAGAKTMQHVMHSSIGYTQLAGNCSLTQSV